MALNSSIIGEYQSRSLEEKINVSNNGADLNWLGFDHSDPECKLEMFGTDANKNRALFWLASDRQDFVRQGDKGGILKELLSVINNDTDLSMWEETLKSKFNQEFQNDLEVKYLKLAISKSVTTDKTELLITMIVQDLISNSTFTISTGASL